jgi:hypothetical protein
MSFYNGINPREYFNTAVNLAERELNSLGEETFLSNDEERLVEYLDEKYGVFPIEKVSNYIPYDQKDYYQIELEIVHHEKNDDALKLQRMLENSGDYELRNNLRYDKAT